MVKECLLDIGYRMSKDNGYRMTTEDNDYRMTTRKWSQNEYMIMVTECLLDIGYRMS